MKKLFNLLVCLLALPELSGNVLFAQQERVTVQTSAFARQLLTNESAYGMLTNLLQGTNLPPQDGAIATNNGFGTGTTLIKPTLVNPFMSSMRGGPTNTSTTTITFSLPYDPNQPTSHNIITSSAPFFDVSPVYPFTNGFAEVFDSLTFATSPILQIEVLLIIDSTHAYVGSGNGSPQTIVNMTGFYQPNLAIWADDGGGFQGGAIDNGGNWCVPLHDNNQQFLWNGTNSFAFVQGNVGNPFEANNFSIRSLWNGRDGFNIAPSVKNNTLDLTTQGGQATIGMSGSTVEHITNQQSGGSVKFDVPLTIGSTESLPNIGTNLVLVTDSNHNVVGVTASSFSGSGIATNNGAGTRTSLASPLIKSGLLNNSIAVGFSLSPTNTLTLPGTSLTGTNQQHWFTITGTNFSSMGVVPGWSFNLQGVNQFWVDDIINGGATVLVHPALNANYTADTTAIYYPLACTNNNINGNPVGAFTQDGSTVIYGPTGFVDNSGQLEFSAGTNGQFFQTVSDNQSGGFALNLISIFWNGVISSDSPFIINAQAHLQAFHINADSTVSLSQPITNDISGTIAFTLPITVPSISVGSTGAAGSIAVKDSSGSPFVSLNSSGVTSKVSNGASPAALSPGSSPWTFTWSGANGAFVITGGTVTGVTINGSAVPITSTASWTPMAVGDVAVITYTGSLAGVRKPF